MVVADEAARNARAREDRAARRGVGDAGVIVLPVADHAAAAVGRDRAVVAGVAANFAVIADADIPARACAQDGAAVPAREPASLKESHTRRPDIAARVRIRDGALVHADQTAESGMRVFGEAGRARDIAGRERVRDRAAVLTHEPGAAKRADLHGSAAHENAAPTALVAYGRRALP